MIASWFLNNDNQFYRFFFETLKIFMYFARQSSYSLTHKIRINPPHGDKQQTKFSDRLLAGSLFNTNYL